MTRHDDARSYLASWDPDTEELPDWVADALDDDADLAAAFDARFAPWDGKRLADPALPAEAPRRSAGWGVAAGLGLLAAGLAGTLLVGGGIASLTLTRAEAPDDSSRVARVLDPDEPLLPQTRTASPPEALQGRHAVVDELLAKNEGDFYRGSRPAEETQTALEALGYLGEDEVNLDKGLVGHRTAGQTLRSVEADEFRWWGGHEAQSGLASDGKLVARLQTGTVAPDGNQDARVEIRHRRIDIRERVVFGGRDAEPADASAPLLDDVAKLLTDNPQLEVVLEGHSVGGSPQGDLKLSEARAKNVRSQLIARGVDPGRLQVEAVGNARPVVQEGQLGNARVEFRLADQEAPAPVRVEAPASEDYTDYGHHSFTVVDEDPRSTFAVDVDTASYTLTRRKLQEGYLPPRAAVRVEEFVNYLPYTYRPPVDTDAPFSVSFEGVPNPFNDRTHLVRIGVQGKKVAVDQRRPVHLTFLVDTSGSMQSDDKLGLVKVALGALTEELRDGDTVAIVAYAGSAGVVLEPTPMSRRGEVMKALDRLRAGGSTAMGDGISLAYQLALQSYHDGAVNRVVILSDGDANVGKTDHEALVEEIRQYARQGITLTTAGFGQGNYKDTRMEQLANQGDGNYWYIDSEKEARRVFVDKLTSTMVVIAKDVKLQVEFDPEVVEAYRLVGYENRDIADRDFRNDAVDAGEIGAGHQVTALYEVALVPGATGDLARLNVRNKAPGPESPAVERAYALPTGAIRSSFAEGGADLRVAVAAASFGELLRGNPHLHGAGFADIARIARDAQRVEYPEDAELITLIEQAARLSGENGGRVSRE